MNNPYGIVISRRLTEKSRVLEHLQFAKSNPSLARCQSPKAVFNVHQKANKAEIARAIEQIYAAKNVKVVAVNTITIGPKSRRVRGFLGKTAGYKKAIVTFRPGDAIDEQV
ncbi:MAG: 50S ribosomal protein L23 [Chlamydiia bacterium]|nr:50S ribosomal protein L23 [Chlamydiia bacterium]